VEASVDVAYVQEHARLPVPTVALALQEVVEEAELELAPIVGVVVRPVLEAVELEPLLLGHGAEVAVGVAAKVQPVPTPVAGRQERLRDLRPVGNAFLEILVDQRMVTELLSE